MLKILYKNKIKNKLKILKNLKKFILKIKHKNTNFKEIKNITKIYD